MKPNKSQIPELYVSFLGLWFSNFKIVCVEYWLREDLLSGSIQMNWKAGKIQMPRPYSNPVKSESLGVDSGLGG